MYKNLTETVVFDDSGRFTAVSSHFHIFTSLKQMTWQILVLFFWVEIFCVLGKGVYSAQDKKNFPLIFFQQGNEETEKISELYFLYIIPFIPIVHVNFIP